MTDSKIEWLKARPYLCLYPYEKIDMRLGNNFQTLNVTCCCNLDLSQNKENLNFNLLNSVKEQMAAGIAPKECKRCYREEAVNLVSERMRRLLRKDMGFLEKFDANRNHIEIIQVGILLSRLCNLACKSCGASSSSTFSKLTGLGINQPIRDLFDSQESKKMFFTLIEQYHKEALERDVEFVVSLIGGETLLQQGFITCCEALVNMNIGRDTTLLITSNMTVPWNKQQLELLKQFKKIKLVCSIDSVGDNYTYVRWPASFSKIENNMLRLLADQEILQNKIEYFIQPVWSLNNIFYIDDFLDYWYNWAVKHDQNLRLDTINLNEPTYLQPNILPDPYRSHLTILIERVINHKIFTKFPKAHTLHAWLQTLNATLSNPQPLDARQQFDWYLRSTADYDFRAKTNGFDLNNRLFSLLSEDDQDKYYKFYNSVDLSKRMFYKWGNQTIDDYI